MQKRFHKLHNVMSDSEISQVDMTRFYHYHRGSLDKTFSRPAVGNV